MSKFISFLFCFVPAFSCLAIDATAVLECKLASSSSGVIATFSTAVGPHKSTEKISVNSQGIESVEVTAYTDLPSSNNMAISVELFLSSPASVTFSKQVSTASTQNFSLFKFENEQGKILASCLIKAL